jgi:hypothetical protein
MKECRMRLNMTFMASILLLGLSSAGTALAANAPTVTLTYTSNPIHPYRPPAWFFPGETVPLHTTVTGNPDYLINDPNNDGGKYVELYSNSSKVDQIRINGTNTTYLYTVILPTCPPSICNPPAYGPFSFGSPTNVDFTFTLPVGVQGTRTFSSRFSGDPFTSSANSAGMSITVSCAARPILPPPPPPANPNQYPPAGSGCP